jgi:hypothetical protein
MPHSFKLSRRIARLRAPCVAALIFTLVGCNSTDSLNPDSSSPAAAAPTAGTLATPADPSFVSTSFVGGIPIGTFRQPTTEFGSMFNGAMRTIYPQFLLSELAGIKARGGKVALMFAGPEHYYKDGAGHFDLGKWKARIDRFNGVNFSSYIADGTIIGHYLIDEPQDPANWNRVPVPQATLEEMAKYSKQKWPTMATIVRTWPAYLAKWSGKYVALDAAWAQYAANRFPNMQDFINTNVSSAQSQHLALIVGLNMIDGGPNKGEMTASQVKTYGTALLSSAYPCAFLSWQYRPAYLASADMKAAMAALRSKAQAHASKTCRGG